MRETVSTILGGVRRMPRDILYVVLVFFYIWLCEFVLLPAAKLNNWIRGVLK